MTRRGLVGSAIFLSFLVGLAAPAPGRAADASATTVLVIDGSASMKKEGRAEAARLAAALYVQMAAPMGPLAVVTFGEKATVVAEPQELRTPAEVRALVTRIEQIEFKENWTEYRAGLEAAAQLLEGRGPGRIVFLTDGDIDPDPADPFHQTDAVRAELAKAPRCAEAGGKTVAKGAYGGYPPHQPCTDVYKVLVDQSAAQIEDQLLPRLKQQGVRVSTVALQVTGDASVGMLRAWSSSTGGRLFQAKQPGELPRLFSEAFAAATASLMVPVKAAFEVEPRIRMLQVVAASRAPVTASLIPPDGPLTCGARPLAECFTGESPEPRGGVVRVAAPTAGKWKVALSGPGAAGAEVVLVKQYDLMARLRVAGAATKEVGYLDEADLRQVEVELLSGNGDRLPADAGFLRDVTAVMHLPSQGQHLPMKSIGPGVFQATVTPPPATVPPKRWLRDQEPARREAHPLHGEVLLAGNVVAAAQGTLAPVSLTLRPEARPIRYPAVEEPFPVAVTAEWGPGRPLEPGRLAGASVELRQKGEPVAALACDAAARCAGTMVRAKRVRGPEKLDMTLVRGPVALGAGTLEVELAWTWLDYFLKYGVPLLVALAVVILVAGKKLPPRFSKEAGVTIELAGSRPLTYDLENVRNPLFKASTAVVEPPRGPVSEVRLTALGGGQVRSELTFRGVTPQSTTSPIRVEYEGEQYQIIIRG